jgi:hypothetical protein
MTPQTSTTQQPAKPKIRYLGRTSYSVESRTRADHMHYVDTYRLTCTCEAGKYGKRCWALVAALGYEDWRRRQQAQAAASAARLLAPAQPGQPKAGMAALQEAF